MTKGGALLTNISEGNPSSLTVLAWPHRGAIRTPGPIGGENEERVRDMRKRKRGTWDHGWGGTETEKNAKGKSRKMKTDVIGLPRGREKHKTGAILKEELGKSTSRKSVTICKG